MECSFCGKTNGQVKYIIAAQKAYICCECVDLCSDILAEKESENMLKKRVDILEDFTIGGYIGLDGYGSILKQENIAYRNPDGVLVISEGQIPNNLLLEFKKISPQYEVKYYSHVEVPHTVKFTNPIIQGC